jgi:hypothetical protein
MSTTVVSSPDHAHKRFAWVAIGGFGDCDFGDNREVTDSYFDEADMNS